MKDEKYELDKIEFQSKKNKDTIKYLVLSFTSAIMYLVIIASIVGSDKGGIGLLIYTILFTIILTMINWWYINKQKIYKEEEKNKYTLAKHVKTHGIVLEGQVVHIKEERHYIYSDDEEVELIFRILIIKFNEDGETRYIIKTGFPHEVKLINADKDEVVEIYKDSAEKIEAFKENCINIYQYEEDGCISFTDLTGEAKMNNYADSIEKNYVGDYTCKIYSYKGRYVVGDIEGYDYEAENLKKQYIANEDKVQKRKELVIYVILIIVLIMLSSGL